MNTGILESFFYELFAYCIPGFVCVQTGIAFRTIYMKNEYTLNALAEYWFTVDYSTSIWILLVVFSLVLGMILTLISTSLGTSRFFRYFGSHYGLYYMFSHQDKYPLAFHDSYNFLVEKFAIMIPPDESSRYKLFDYIGDIITKYIQEESKAQFPLGRYVSRMVMAKNLSIAVIFTTVLFAFSLDISTGDFYLMLISGLGIAILLLFYCSRQSLWRAEYLLSRLCVLIPENMNQVSEVQKMARTNRRWEARRGY